MGNPGCYPTSMQLGFVPLLEAGIVDTMGCGDACPVYPGRRYLDWDLEDPVDKPLATVRRIRDDIDTRVRMLLSELFTEVTPEPSHKK